MYLKYYTTRDDGEGGIEFLVIDYEKTTGLSFAPQVDLTGDSLPINELIIDVITTDDFKTGEVIELYDDMDQVWAHWYIKKAIHTADNVVRITARSLIDSLEYKQMEAVMFENSSAASAIDACFDGRTSDYQIDSSLSSAKLTGFAPEQTARERLAWILFALGAYVRDVFTTKAHICPVDETSIYIPTGRSFFRPTTDLNDWVTEIRITSYAFSRASSEDEWEDSDSSYMFPLPWIAEEQTISLLNPNAPEDATENVIELDGIYLVNSGNVSDIISRLAKYWFNRNEVTLDCVNNKQFSPGDKVVAYAADESILTGYIQQATFKFGLQARSTLKLIGVDNVAGTRLTVNYTYNNGRIGQAEYFFPVGYTYTITNPYIDRTYQDRRFIYRPENATISGTIVEGANVVEQACDIVLEYYDGTLSVYSVDEIELQTSGNEYTGVIS